MIDEFKKFALRGNMLDLAVAVIIGGAFGSIVTSLVSDILMPPLGKLLGGVDFSSLFIVLGGGSYPSIKAAKDAGAATINYGVFFNTIINFVIVAAALFFVVKAMNRAVAQPAPAAVAAPTDKECPFCATRIPLAAKRCPHCTSSL
jgi:large conductance mechanosensitive channel